MALLGFPLAAGVPAAGEPGSVCAGSFLAVEDPHAPAPRGARGGLELWRESGDRIFTLSIQRVLVFPYIEAGLVKGDRIGVDASTMEANAALRNIVRRDPSGLHRRRQKIRIKFLAP